MTVELQMLACAILLTLLQMVAGAVGNVRQIGLPAAAGNRENLPAAEGWAGRARRAHANMLENLPLFAAAVLIAHAAGRESAMSALGAQIFVAARAVYAVVYIAGVPWVRTLVWAASMVGLGLVLLQIF